MRQISEKHAKELALISRRFSAEAYRFGLANILCELGLAVTRALSLAKKFEVIMITLAPVLALKSRFSAG